eukprot:TRINITY_DN3469_c2_g1_i2.p2 TRINITY_DN3469_c2_g1~~TRINITY_DN3469_c2_g1_i2.p2  ORF type:complete len:119 (+),score=32.18 TRINITY_DN3469_c2_g1_i2:67-423(+)
MAGVSPDGVLGTGVAAFFLLLISGELDPARIAAAGAVCIAAVTLGAVIVRSVQLRRAPRDAKRPQQQQQQQQPPPEEAAAPAPTPAPGGSGSAPGSGSGPRRRPAAGRTGGRGAPAET